MHAEEALAALFGSVVGSGGLLECRLAPDPATPFGHGGYGLLRVRDEAAAARAVKLLHDYPVSWGGGGGGQCARGPGVLLCPRCAHAACRRGGTRVGAAALRCVAVSHIAAAWGPQQRRRTSC